MLLLIEDVTQNSLDSNSFNDNNKDSSTAKYIKAMLQQLIMACQCIYKGHCMLMIWSLTVTS